MIAKFMRDDDGQDLTEYALLLAFVVLASAGLHSSVGGSVSGIWGSASTQLGAAATSAS